MLHAVHGVAKSWTLLSDWTELSDLCIAGSRTHVFHFTIQSPSQNYLKILFFFNFYFALFFNFTILYWFCHISKWICHRFMSPHPEPSSLLPPHTIPLGRPSAPAPSILYRVSNLDWRLISYMILYVFQCHSPKPSHPLPLPQSPKDCSVHHCLFCCLVYRVIVTIFLNSTSICFYSDFSDQPWSLQKSTCYYQR